MAAKKGTMEAVVTVAEDEKEGTVKKNVVNKKVIKKVKKTSYY